MESMVYVTQTHNVTLRDLLLIASNLNISNKLTPAGEFDEELTLDFGVTEYGKRKWCYLLHTPPEKLLFDTEEEKQQFFDLAPSSVFVIIYTVFGMRELLDFLKHTMSKYDGWVDVGDDQTRFYEKDNLDDSLFPWIRDTGS